MRTPLGQKIAFDHRNVLLPLYDLKANRIEEKEASEIYRFGRHL